MKKIKLWKRVLVLLVSIALIMGDMCTYTLRVQAAEEGTVAPTEEQPVEEPPAEEPQPAESQPAAEEPPAAEPQPEAGDQGEQKQNSENGTPQ